MRRLARINEFVKSFIERPDDSHRGSRTNFIILSGPRSGSTWLQRTLDSHKEIMCLHELFRNNLGKSVFYGHFLGRRNQFLRQRQDGFAPFIHAVFNAHSPSEILAIGFKALYTQPGQKDSGARDEAWQVIAALQGLKIIKLTRNPVSSVVSFAIAKQTGSWIGKRTVGSVEIDAQYFLRRLELEYKLENEICAITSEHEILHVSYEMLHARTDQVLSEIQTFLGVGQRKLTSQTEKQNSLPLAKIVGNWSEIGTSLKGTRWYDSYIEISN